MPKRASKSPKILVCNRQRIIRVNLDELKDFAALALEECLRTPGKSISLLTDLENLDIVLISDRRMAEIHRRFLKTAGPTDVITFQHGEILISPETAHRHARAFGSSFEVELRLYIVHGLLHLHGYDDKRRDLAEEMDQTQRKVIHALKRSRAKS